MSRPQSMDLYREAAAAYSAWCLAQDDVTGFAARLDPAYGGSITFELHMLASEMERYSYRHLVSLEELVRFRAGIGRLVVKVADEMAAKARAEIAKRGHRRLP